MEPTNCPRCGKVFMRIRESVCPDCVKKEEQTFEEVRAYVKENPNQRVKDVAEACNVSVKRIIRYIREGRLEASTGMHGEITCSSCGKPISHGHMCEVCISKVSTEVGGMKKENVKYHNQSHMYTNKR